MVTLPCTLSFSVLLKFQPHYLLDGQYGIGKEPNPVSLALLEKIKL